MSSYIAQGPIAIQGSGHEKIFVQVKGSSHFKDTSEMILSLYVNWFKLKIRAHSAIPKACKYTFMDIV